MEAIGFVANNLDMPDQFSLAISKHPRRYVRGWHE